MKGHVHIAGAGAISAIGNTLQETLVSFQQEVTGIGPITHLETIHRGVLPVGEVKLTDDELRRRTGSKALSRTTLLGIHAAREAVASAGIRSLKKWRTGLISATTVGGMDRTEDFFSAFVSNPAKGRLRDVADHECGRSTEQIADALDIHSYISTINTACSSSVNSIIFGARLIRQGLLDVVIAGGTDALTKFTLNGFNSLMILDKEPCRPFDAGRGGLNLGEGAGFLVLVSDHVARGEGLAPMCHVSGYANTNDAYHQTASSPEGRGSLAAMTDAMKLADLLPEHIDYINLHGTGTVNNDQSEGTAIGRLFPRIPKVSSTKAFTGHTLGACGGLEAAFSVLAIRHGVVFPNLRFRHPMPDLNIVPQTTFETGLTIRHVMSNSFGFGGNCSSVIFSRHDSVKQ